MLAVKSSKTLLPTDVVPRRCQPQGNLNDQTPSFYRWFQRTGISFLFLLLLAHCKPKESQVAIQPPPRVHVVTKQVIVQRVPSFLSVTGSVEALLETDLAANATGKVVKVYAQRGDEIKRGQLLAVLDVKLVGLQARAAQLQSQVASAQAESSALDCIRLQRLIDAGAGTQADYERQQSQCKISKLNVSTSRVQASVAAKAVKDGRIAAPFDSFLVERFIEPGEYVLPSTKVATLVSLDPLVLRISVPEIHLAQLKKGLTITFHVAAYPDRVFTATLTRISPVVLPATRHVLAEAEFSNPDKILHPGMFAKIDLPIGEVDLPVVPKEALFEKEGATHLFVVVDKRIEERVVQVGTKLDNEVALVKGVSQGEHIVVKPGPEVKNGLLTE